MSKKMLTILVGCAFATVATTAQACPSDKNCKCGTKTAKVADKAPNEKGVVSTSNTSSAPCSKSVATPCSKSSARLVAAQANPHVETILTRLPKLQYKVGDTVTCCSKSAAKMGEESNGKIVYLVGDKSFESEGDAKVALTAALQAELDNLKSMQFAVGEKCVRCPITAKSMVKSAGGKIAYRVGGLDFVDKAKAEKAVALVADAADSVKLSFKVGDKSFCCDKMAGAAAKEAGQSVTFVVGDEETPCKATAELLLTQAKLHAIIAAAAAALAS